MPLATIDSKHKDGSVITDFVTRVTERELEALAAGPHERAEINEFTHAVVWALMVLRTLESAGDIRPLENPKLSDVVEANGAGTEAEALATLHALIRVLEGRLIPRLAGVRDGCVRWHSKLGGSYGELAEAMGVARSTAQTRAQAITYKEPSEGEKWARALDRPTSHLIGARHSVTIDLDDPDVHFVLTDALRDFASQMNGEAEETRARVTAGAVAEDHQRGELADADQRSRWASAAENLLDQIDGAL